MENNPVNYTDPSGHRKKGSRPKRQNIVQKFTNKVKQVFNVFKPAKKTANKKPTKTRQGGKTSTPKPKPKKQIDPKRQRYYNNTPVPGLNDIHGRSISLADYTSQKIRHTPGFKAPKTYQNAFGSQAATYQKPVYTPQTAYQASQSYGGYAAQTMYSPLAKAQANGQSTYNWGQSTSREVQRSHRNWTKALEEFLYLYRKGGKYSRQRPQMVDYNLALKKSLLDAGLTIKQADEVLTQAIQQQEL